MEPQLYQLQSRYQKAILFAARKHQGQKIPGTDLPYLVHLSNVAMEILIASATLTDFDVPFATTLALLHDTLEDTDTTYEELSAEFGKNIAESVTALTKDPSLEKKEKMIKSLDAIKKLSKEVWMVKIADRITNLQKPPSHWDNDKIYNYWKEAVDIHNHLFISNNYLSLRLGHQIQEYQQYVKIPPDNINSEIPPSHNSI